MPAIIRIASAVRSSIFPIRSSLCAARAGRSGVRHIPEFEGRRNSGGRAVARRLGYRARVKLVVRKVAAPSRRDCTCRKSHRVMDISSCPVHPRRVNQVLEYLKFRAQELGIAPYDERDDSGDCDTSIFAIASPARKSASLW